MTNAELLEAIASEARDVAHRYAEYDQDPSGVVLAFRTFAAKLDRLAARVERELL